MSQAAAELAPAPAPKRLPTSLAAGFTLDPESYRAPIRELGLEGHVKELETQGYTVIPPHKVAPPEFIDRMREAILRIAEQRTGVKHNVAENANSGKYKAYGANKKSAFTLFYILFADPIFEEWLENPVMSAMVNYSLKGQAHLSSYTSFIKWRDPDGDPDKWVVPLHADGPNGPDGNLLGLGELTVNCALCLTEYTRENGSIWIVPGSHAGREPQPGEGEDLAIPIEAPVGSLIFFKTWHGSRAKTTDGLRLTVTSFFSNRMIKTLDRYQGVVPKEMLDRRSAQFARYVGADDSSNAGIEGPQPNYFGQVEVW